MKIIKFNQEEKYIKDFLSLPKMLYDKKTNMENPKEIELLLKGTHPLNKYFKLYKFILEDNGKPIGRFAITIYPNDDVAYLGFYECINNDKAAKKIFEYADKFVKDLGFKKIVGPVDASFWNKYRLKINMFDKVPYSGEPYNKDYYFKQFKDNKYKVIEHYVSRIFDVVPDDYHNAKFEEHLKEFNDLGYEIRSPKEEELDKTIEEVYYMIMDLYKDFPIFKDISLNDFKEVFGSIKMVANTSMIKMAYYKGKAVGFYISIPNYNNLIYHTNNLFNILKILKLKKHPKDYVMLYMGVDQKHIGLGKALSGAIVEELRINKLPSLSALAKDGKITQTYASEMVNTVYEYVLLERKIK